MDWSGAMGCHKMAFHEDLSTVIFSNTFVRSFVGRKPYKMALSQGRWRVSISLWVLVSYWSSSEGAGWNGRLGNRLGYLLVGMECGATPQCTFSPAYLLKQLLNLNAWLNQTGKSILFCRGRLRICIYWCWAMRASHGIFCVASW